MEVILLSDDPYSATIAFAMDTDHIGTCHLHHALLLAYRYISICKFLYCWNHYCIRTATCMHWQRLCNVFIYVHLICRCHDKDMDTSLYRWVSQFVIFIIVVAMPPSSLTLCNSLFRVIFHGDISCVTLISVIRLYMVVYSLPCHAYSIPFQLRYGIRMCMLYFSPHTFFPTFIPIIFSYSVMSSCITKATCKEAQGPTYMED